jgi:DNA-binding transcriptional regulator PaaX
LSLDDITESTRKKGTRNTNFSHYQSERVRIQDELDALGICDLAAADMRAIRNILHRTVHDLNEMPNDKTYLKWREKLKQSAVEIGISNTSSLNELVSKIFDLNEINRAYEENLKKIRFVRSREAL